MVDFDICGQAMLSAWSSHAVFRKSLFSEMRGRYQTRRRPIQEDSILSYLCLEFRLRIFTGINSSLVLFVESGIYVREEIIIHFCRYCGIKCKAWGIAAWQTPNVVWNNAHRIMSVPVKTISVAMCAATFRFNTLWLRFMVFHRCDSVWQILFAL
jgi:hypothetical protein